MEKLLQYLLVAFAFIEITYSVKVDMGQCSCNWATPSDETLSSQFLGGYQSGKFYERIRGFKGEMGRAGEPGLSGHPGIKGDSGLRGPPAPELTKNQQADGAYSSCSDVPAVGGEVISGVYTIRPVGTTSKPMQLYCESTIDGGGWTLVASVHENNIEGKCTIGDNWSSDQGVQQNNMTRKGRHKMKHFRHFAISTKNESTC